MSSARRGGHMEMTDRDPMLEPFDVLIGSWSTEARHPMVDEAVLGSATYEWLEGGHFAVLRSHNDQVVSGRDQRHRPPESGEGLALECFDSRGVRRTYGVSLEDGVLRWWRDHPGFDQRSYAELVTTASSSSISSRRPRRLARRPGG